MNTVRLTTLVVPPRIQQGDQLMGKHVAISPVEAADRLAMRELVEAYDSFQLAKGRVEDIG
jgi:hypothetical protein